MSIQPLRDDPRPVPTQTVNVADLPDLVQRIRLYCAIADRHALALRRDAGDQAAARELMSLLYDIHGVLDDAINVTMRECGADGEFGYDPQHPQVPADGIMVDERIAPLLIRLWSRGWKTECSCQGEEDGSEDAYIKFIREDAANQFFRFALAVSSPALDEVLMAAQPPCCSTSEDTVHLRHWTVQFPAHLIEPLISVL